MGQVQQRRPQPAATPEVDILRNLASQDELQLAQLVGDLVGRNDQDLQALLNEIPPHIREKVFPVLDQIAGDGPYFHHDDDGSLWGVERNRTMASGSAETTRKDGGIERDLSGTVGFNRFVHPELGGIHNLAVMADVDTHQRSGKDGLEVGLDADANVYWSNTDLPGLTVHDLAVHGGKAELSAQASIDDRALDLRGDFASKSVDWLNTDIAGLIQYHDLHMGPSTAQMWANIDGKDPSFDLGMDVATSGLDWVNANHFGLKNHIAHVDPAQAQLRLNQDRGSIDVVNPNFDWTGGDYKAAQWHMFQGSGENLSLSATRTGQARASMGRAEMDWLNFTLFGALHVNKITASLESFEMGWGVNEEITAKVHGLLDKITPLMAKFPTLEGALDDKEALLEDLEANGLLELLDALTGAGYLRLKGGAINFREYRLGPAEGWGIDIDQGKADRVDVRLEDRAVRIAIEGGRWTAYNNGVDGLWYLRLIDANAKRIEHEMNGSFAEKETGYRVKVENGHVRVFSVFNDLFKFDMKIDKMEVDDEGGWLWGLLPDVEQFEGFSATWKAGPVNLTVGEGFPGKWEW